MKSKLLIFISIIIIIVTSVIGNKLINEKEPKKIDIVSINNTIKTAEENFNNINEELFDDNIKVTFINNSGDILYSNYIKNKKSYDKFLLDAYTNQDTVIDIVVDHKIVGKGIFKNNTENFNYEKKEIKRSLYYILLVYILLLLTWIIYLYMSIIRPFNKLQKFAMIVAKGNLDFPLEMDKKNIFGAFTESFSIMREELKIAKEKEHKANKSKKELVASLSHDIKTPVASIKAITELMTVTTENDKDKDRLKIIFDKSEQIEKLINDMFHSTLDELQELKVNCNEYNSNIILEFINENNYYNKIKIVNKIPEVLILVDKLRIGQVIGNIINNSYKYANTNIEVSFEINKTHLLVYIKDFGRGINEEELPLIFNKFYRGSNTKEKEGSGLGLYLSKYFMKNMSGDISCINNKDGFLVLLEIKLV